MTQKKDKALVLNIESSGEQFSMPENTPVHLWKYMPPPIGNNATKYSRENLENLFLRDTIRMTGVTEVNDPFDCSPVIIDDVTNDLIFAKAERLISQAQENSEMEYMRRAVVKRYPTKLIRRKKRGQIIREYRPYIVESSKGFFDKFGFYSLSETHTNPAMWAHYSANSSGICIGFKNRGPNPGFATSLPVKYENARPFINLSLSLSDKKADQEKHSMQLLHAFRTKSPAWSYEKERRFLSGIEVGTFNSGDLVKINKPNISFVLFGAKVSDANKVFVKKLIEKSGSMNVKLLQANLCEKTYKIKFFRAK